MGNNWYYQSFKMKHVEHLRQVGLPLNVWLRGQETIDFIIKKYLAQSMDHIQFCYRMKESKAQKISKRRWSEYRPYEEFGYTASSNDYLMFVCRNTEDLPTRILADQFVNAEKLKCF